MNHKRLNSVGKPIQDQQSAIKPETDKLAIKLVTKRYTETTISVKESMKIDSLIIETNKDSSCQQLQDNYSIDNCKEFVIQPDKIMSPLPLLAKGKMYADDDAHQ